jgi:glycopeptide antibiotics resistance protein
MREEGRDRALNAGDSPCDGTVFVQVEAPFISGQIGRSCLVLYIIVVGWLTLTPRPGTPNTAPEWIPYASLEPVLANLWTVTRHPEYLEFIDPEALKHVVGNVLLFIPLGWLLPVLWDGAISAGRIVAVAAFTSLTIELWQLSIPGRMSAIDDVILNALGAGIGAMILFWVGRMVARKNGP